MINRLKGLQSVVDDKEQVNELSTKDLRNLFKLRVGTPSDTHDKLRCERCEIIADNAEQDAKKVLPKQLAACKDLIEVMSSNEDAAMFLTPLKPEDHGVSSETYDKAVKQPIDLGTIRAKLDAELTQSIAYKSPSAFSKDVNRIFTNVMKVWEPGQEIADAARRLQSWWMEQWTALVPRVMNMTPDEDKENLDPNNPTSEDNQISCAFVHNERGDNFQEQIGMPDEENMRHWSHHHSSDTVDDPVFRAAMRGYDAVSFVFGLEVTWSLIQQRQQEEEEKKAMQELECMQSMQTEENIDHDEDDDGEKDENNDKSHIPITKENEDSTTDTDESSSLSIDEKSIPTPCGKSENGDEEVHVEQVEYHGEEKKDDETMIIEISTSPDVSEAVISSSPENKRVSSQSSVWSCDQCTFDNKPKAKKCSMCGKKKKTPKKRKL